MRWQIEGVNQLNDMTATATTIIPTVSEIEALVAAGKLRRSHTGSRRGYTSRKGNGYVEAYKGKFGEGFAVISPRFDTTRYVDVTYFLNA